MKTLSLNLPFSDHSSEPLFEYKVYSREKCGINLTLQEIKDRKCAEIEKVVMQKTDETKKVTETLQEAEANNSRPLLVGYDNYKRSSFTHNNTPSLSSSPAEKKRRNTI